MKQAIAGFLLLVLAACGSYGPVETSPDDVQKLAAGLRALGPDVDPQEADRAARIAFSYTAQLAREYEITDPPLVHNTKVNMGLKPRGLCWHWAEDMQKRLEAENFQTLDVLRAIANAHTDFLIDHSTALLAPKGGDLEQAMVLDPWRFGGRLFWGTVPSDTRYAWVAQDEVHAVWRDQIARGLR